MLTNVIKLLIRAQHEHLEMILTDVTMIKCTTLVLLLRCETGKVRDRFAVWVALRVG